MITLGKKMAEGKKEREMDESLLLQIRVVENRGKKDWIDFKTTKKTMKLESISLEHSLWFSFLVLKIITILKILIIKILGTNLREKLLLYKGSWNWSV